MQVKLLIDGIVRQTMVLVARLSTSAGVKSPLGHIADQVFLDLTRELESQGVKRRVVADMFGMGLRSYQKKVHRLLESKTDQGRTLWEVVLGFIEAEELPTRERIDQRFCLDGKPEVAAVLKDLVASGLVHVTGTGRNAVYGATTALSRTQIQRGLDAEAIEHVLWLEIFRGDCPTQEELLSLVAAEPTLVEDALERLVSKGIVTETDGKYSAGRFTIPIGADVGWESAILDHYYAVSKAIAKKVASGVASSADPDVGGSTFRYEIYPEHPFYDQVTSQFKTMRNAAQTLWDNVSAYNQKHPTNVSESQIMTFYMGHLVEAKEPEGEDDDQ